MMAFVEKLYSSFFFLRRIISQSRDTRCYISHAGSWRNLREIQIPTEGGFFIWGVNDIAGKKLSRSPADSIFN